MGHVEGPCSRPEQVFLKPAPYLAPWRSPSPPSVEKLMRTRRWFVLAIVCLGAVGVATAVLVRQSTPAQQVYQSKAVMYSHDANISEEDLDALAQAIALGTTPPASVALEDNCGVVTGILTGLVLEGPGEHQFTVTINDDEADLDTARLFLGGQQVAIATIANGGVVVRSGKAIAALTGFTTVVPPENVKVEWSGPSTSAARSDEVTFY